MSTSKDLTKEAPRSPGASLGGYILLARMADKGRAVLDGKAGEYHFACPLDQMLFDFRGVKADDVKEQLSSGAGDEQLVEWFNAHGTPKTQEEFAAWAGGISAYRPYDDPEKKEWFAGECAKIGLKPEDSTLFDFLDADDIASFKK